MRGLCRCSCRKNVQRSHVVRPTAAPQDPEVAPVVEDLARREVACCAFLNIDAAHTERGVRLIMTSENPDALPVIEMLVGGPKLTS